MAAEVDAAAFQDFLRSARVKEALSSALLDLYEHGPQHSSQALGHLAEHVAVDRPSRTQAAKPPHRGRAEFIKYVDTSDFPKALMKALVELHALHRAGDVPADVPEFLRLRLEAYANERKAAAGRRPAMPPPPQRAAKGEEPMASPVAASKPAARRAPKKKPAAEEPAAAAAEPAIEAANAAVRAALAAAAAMEAVTPPPPDPEGWDERAAVAGEGEGHGDGDEAAGAARAAPGPDRTFPEYLRASGDPGAEGVEGVEGAPGVAAGKGGGQLGAATEEAAAEPGAET